MSHKIGIWFVGLCLSVVFDRLYDALTHILQGLYSVSGRVSYHKISGSLEAAILDVIMIVSLWNVTGISAALLPRCLSNFEAIGKVETRISRLRDFTRSYGKTSTRLMKRGRPGSFLDHHKEQPIGNVCLTIWTLGDAAINKKWPQNVSWTFTLYYNDITW